MEVQDVMTLIGKPKIEVIEWMQRDGLLSREMWCHQHEHAIAMRLRRDAGRNDNYAWRCGTCRRRRSIREGSFFELFRRIELGHLLALLVFWSLEVKQVTSSRLLGVSKRSVLEVYNHLSSICSDDLDRRPLIPFGGPVSILQIDESKFCGKRKPFAKIVRIVEIS
ncbi:hypothetical protein AC249_AIPGENE17265 [Exaiptasia diaphana]|nr:hypothetical protein AC249_AIPGENE17265 [Exaiptasia diaphana]